MALAEPGLAAAATARPDGSVDVALGCHAPALFVSLVADRPGRFDDNVLTLRAGGRRVVRFRPEGEGLPPRFTVHDLTSLHRPGRPALRIGTT
jgi:hypothetical protein